MLPGTAAGSSARHRSRASSRPAVPAGLPSPTGCRPAANAAGVPASRAARPAIPPAAWQRGRNRASIPGHPFIIASTKAAPVPFLASPRRRASDPHQTYRHLPPPAHDVPAADPDSHPPADPAAARRPSRPARRAGADPARAAAACRPERPGVGRLGPGGGAGGPGAAGAPASSGSQRVVGAAAAGRLRLRQGSLQARRRGRPTAGTRAALPDLGAAVGGGRPTAGGGRDRLRQDQHARDRARRDR